jgi:hypothetical protein
MITFGRNALWLATTERKSARDHDGRAAIPARTLTTGACRSFTAITVERKG